jgi:hypothetical protein
MSLSSFGKKHFLFNCFSSSHKWKLNYKISKLLCFDRLRDVFKLSFRPFPDSHLVRNNRDLRLDYRYFFRIVKHLEDTGFPRYSRKIRILNSQAKSPIFDWKNCRFEPFFPMCISGIGDKWPRITMAAIKLECNERMSPRKFCSL